MVRDNDLGGNLLREGLLDESGARGSECFRQATLSSEPISSIPRDDLIATVFSTGEFVSLDSTGRDRYRNNEGLTVARETLAQLAIFCVFV